MSLRHIAPLFLLLQGPIGPQPGGPARFTGVAGLDATAEWLEIDGRTPGIVRLRVGGGRGTRTLSVTFPRSVLRAGGLDSLAALHGWWMARGCSMDLAESPPGGHTALYIPQDPRSGAPQGVLSLRCYDRDASGCEDEGSGECSRWPQRALLVTIDRGPDASATVAFPLGRASERVARALAGAAEVPSGSVRHTDRSRP